MLPDIEPPRNLVELKAATRSALSDLNYILTQERAFSDTPERQVEWDIKRAIAEGRVGQSQVAYEAAFRRHMKTHGGTYEM